MEQSFPPGKKEGFQLAAMRRPCGDFRRLNLATQADKYPVPNLADFSSQLEGCTIFSTLDLKKGYLQVPWKSQWSPRKFLWFPRAKNGA